MPFDPCEPCCDPSAAARDKGTAKQAVLHTLCRWNQRHQTLCDGDGNPVNVTYSYTAAGVLTVVSAYYVDGTPYEGLVSDLTYCVGGAPVGPGTTDWVPFQTAAVNGAGEAWANPSNALVDDAAFASSSIDESALSQYLHLTNPLYGTTIPLGMTYAITFRYKAWGEDNQGNPEEDTIQAIVGGTRSGNNLSQTAVWGGSITTYTRGGDALGLTLDGTEFDANFGLAIRAFAQGNPTREPWTAEIYFAEVKIDWYPPLPDDLGYSGIIFNPNNSASVTLAGADVTAIADTNAIAGNFTAAGALTPTILNVGGLDTLDFDGSNSLVTADSLFDLVGNANKGQVYVVFNLSTFDGNGRRMFDDGLGSLRILVDWDQALKIFQYDGSTNTILTLGAITLSTTYAVRVRWDGVNLYGAVASSNAGFGAESSVAAGGLPGYDSPSVVIGSDILQTGRFFDGQIFLEAFNSTDVIDAAYETNLITHLFGP